MTKTTEQKALKFIDANHLITEGDKVLVALSGGADSVFLLSFLLKFKNRFKIDLAVFHLNHKLRGKSAVEDEKFCSYFCSKNLINAGNANTGTGERGMVDAQACCRVVAEVTGCESNEVLPFSTGVIGENLPLEKFKQGIPLVHASLKEDAWLEVGRGIMTTDTLLKGISRTFELNGRSATITGVAKGSGMIHPNMATMLSFIATDAAVSNALLDKLLKKAVDHSFNSITVDGDTSTNDACVLVATGKAGNPEILSEGADYDALSKAIDDVCMYLAQAIVRVAWTGTRPARSEPLTLSESGCCTGHCAGQFSPALFASPAAMRCAVVFTAGSRAVPLTSVAARSMCVRAAAKQLRAARISATLL